MKHRCPRYRDYMEMRGLSARQKRAERLRRALQRGTRGAVGGLVAGTLGVREALRRVLAPVAQQLQRQMLAELQAYPSGRCDDLLDALPLWSPAPLEADMEQRAYGGARGGGKAFTPAELHVLAWRAAAAA